MKRYLIAGLLVWVPLGITIWVLHFLLTSLDQTLLVLPESVQPRALFGFRHSRAGRRPRLPRSCSLTGVIAANFFGAAADPRVGSGARAHPVRQVDLLVGEAGERHAAVRQGQRVSQGAARRISAAGQLDDRVPDRHAGGRGAPFLPGDHVSVYVPTTPNPTGGYFLMLPRAQVRELDMTVDEALKYIISMGVVAPRAASATRHEAAAQAATRAVAAEPPASEIRN